MKNDGTGVYVNELKRGLTYVNKVFQMFQLIFFTGTPFGTPQTPMNTRFSYTVPYVLYNIYKRVYNNNRIYRLQ